MQGSGKKIQLLKSVWIFLGEKWDISASGKHSGAIVLKNAKRVGYAVAISHARTHPIPLLASS